MYEDLVARRLSQLRTQKGVSAREMSLDIGQNASYINRIENGKTLPSMQGLFYICEYLKITPAEFFSVENQDPTLVADLTSKMRKMSSKQLKIIKEIMESVDDLKK